MCTWRGGRASGRTLEERRLESQAVFVHVQYILHAYDTVCYISMYLETMCVRNSVCLHSTKLCDIGYDQTFSWRVRDLANPLG